MKRNVQVLLAPAAIDDGCRTDDGRTCRSRDLHRLASRTPGRDYIFNDEHALPWLEREAAPQHQLAVLTFRKDGPHPERPSNFLADDNAPEGWRQDDLRVQLSNLGRNLLAAGFSFAWVLEDQRALQVTRTVQPRGQSKMPFQKGTNAPKPI